MTAADRVILNDGPGFRRALFLRDGTCIELWVEAVDDPSLVGGVASVVARVSAGAAVASLPPADPAGSASAGDGYLRDGRPRDGERVVVQVVRDAVPEKRAVLRQRVELAGVDMLLTPSQPGLGLSASITGKARRAAIKAAVGGVLPDDLGLVVRATGADRPVEALAARAQELVTAWQSALARQASTSAPTWLIPPAAFKTRVRRLAPDAVIEVDSDGGAFEEAGGADALERALARRVDIAGLGELVFDTTEAATLIDVNLAASPRGDRLILANSTVARQVAGLARLKGVRGTLLVDFPRMTGRGGREAVRAALEAAAADDPADWQILGWTPGGMLECLRSAEKRSIAEELLLPSSGPMLSPRTRAWSALTRLRREAGGIARPRLLVPVDVARWLAGPGAAIVAAERQRLGALTVAADPSMGINEVHIDSEV